MKIRTKKILGIYLITIAALLFNYTSNRKFNSEIWKRKTVDWWMTDTKESMLNDLLKSDILLNKSEDALISLLGEPSTISSKRMRFLVREKYSTNIDPDYIKYLVVKIDSNGKAIKCEIEQT